MKRILTAALAAGLLLAAPAQAAFFGKKKTDEEKSRELQEKKTEVLKERDQMLEQLYKSDPKLKDEVVMMGGHFDAWHAAGGATDNAAGSAVAMEALRILAAIGAKPRRTIRLGLWDGEEQEDYLGAVGYTDRHFADHVTMRLRPEHARISA